MEHRATKIDDTLDQLLDHQAETLEDGQGISLKTIISIADEAIADRDLVEVHVDYHGIMDMAKLAAAASLDDIEYSSVILESPKMRFAFSYKGHGAYTGEFVFRGNDAHKRAMPTWREDYPTALRSGWPNEATALKHIYCLFLDAAGLDGSISHYQVNHVVHLLSPAGSMKMRVDDQRLTVVFNDTPTMVRKAVSEPSYWQGGPYRHREDTEKGTILLALDRTP